MKKIELIIVSLAILFLFRQSVKAVDPVWTESNLGLFIKNIANDQIKIMWDNIYTTTGIDIPSIQIMKEDLDSIKNVRLPQMSSQLNRIENDLANLKQENQSLRARIEKLENQSSSMPTQNIETKATGYYQYEGKPEIYEVGTNRHIGFTEATQKNIWNDIKIIK